MDMDEDYDPIESVNQLEQTFYQQGYQAGFDHGRLHGLFEGRALGQEKCFDLWEEIGYIEGVALLWKEIGARQAGGWKGGKKVTSRANNHIAALLQLIDQFPTTNPTPILDTSPSPSTATQQDAPSEDHPTSEVDLAALLERIRGRYKLLCSSLAIRPRLGVSSNNFGGISSNQGFDEEDGGGQGQDGSGIVGGIEGPMAGVDTRLLRY